jgi:hypothetical protein
MHTRIIKAVAVATTVGALAVLPAEAGAVTARAASSESISISLHAHITSHQTTGTAHGHGTIQGSLKGTYTAAVSPPLTKYVLKVSGGTIDISTLYNIKGENLSGSWHTTGGSGKYKHVKGTGKASGALATNAVFKLSGTLTY